MIELQSYNGRNETTVKANGTIVTGRGGKDDEASNNSSQEYILQGRVPEEERGKIVKTVEMTVESR